jgi:hypothetical protein
VNSKFVIGNFISHNEIVDNDDSKNFEDVYDDYEIIEKDDANEILRTMSLTTSIRVLRYIG